MPSQLYWTLKEGKTLLELYSSLRPGEVMVLMIISMLGVLHQGIYIGSIWRKRKESFFEIFILLHLIVISVILRELNSAIGSSNILLMGYKNIRWFLGIILVGFAIYIYREKEEKNLLLASILVLVSLPINENLPYGFYSLLFILSLILLTARGMVLYLGEKKKQKIKISKNSIKEALDTQENGILFMEDNGNILLFNKSILYLMKEITGGYFRNGNLFWERLLELEEKPTYYIEEKNLLNLRLEDKSWQFTKKEINYKKKKVFQITAVDVTEEEDINQELIFYDNQLKKQHQDFKRALDKIQELRKEEAISRFWEYIHGTLGHYLSIIQRILKQKPIEVEDLKASMKSMNQDLRAIREVEPEKTYQDMVETFQALGIKLHRKGSLPEDKDISNLFIDIIREGINNAIRHGQSENIDIYLNEKDKRNTLVISNDGEPLREEIKWGGGLKNIKKRVEDLGGQVGVFLQPEFTLFIEVPSIPQKV